MPEIYTVTFTHPDNWYFTYSYPSTFNRFVRSIQFSNLEEAQAFVEKVTAKGATDVELSKGALAC